jgi:hypothetical protein
MKALSASLVVLVALPALLSSDLLAHHSFAAQYDSTKPITLTGTVAKIDWANPHMHFYVDVKDEKGRVTQWTFEGYPPNMLVRQGWKRDVSMKPGDTVTVSGWQARAEPNTAAAREITWSDGRKLTSGPPAGIGGQ